MSEPNKKVKYPCMRCGKNVAKNSKSVQCRTCQLWSHVECNSSIWVPQEVYTILCDPERFGTNLTWSCDNCQASTAILETTVKAYVERVKIIEARADKTEGAMKELDRRVEKVEVESSKTEDKMAEIKESLRTEFYTELRDRKQRMKNVVMHRVGEAATDVNRAEDRREWDLKSCNNIFKALGTKLTSEAAVQFCRRVGERGETPRPLVVGFRTAEDKDLVLNNARKLKDTFFNDVGIVPDLTTTERKEEAGMMSEVDQKNKERTEEDKAKNLHWMVVGKRGERRIIKGQIREDSRRGSNHTEMGRRTERGRGTLLLNPAQDKSRRTGAWGPRTGGPAEGEEDLVAMEEEDQDQVTASQLSTRTRINSKRTRTEDSDTEVEPPNKH